MITLETMSEDEYKAKLHEGLSIMQHMDDCKDPDCASCVQYRREGYEQDRATGLHYSRYERANGRPSVMLVS